MKIKKLVAFLIVASVCMAGLSLDAKGAGSFSEANKGQTSFKRTFSRTVGSNQNSDSVGQAYSSTLSDKPTPKGDTRAFSKDATTRIEGQRSQEWGLFGLTPRYDIEDRSIFPSPSCNINPDSILEHGPCMKPCGSKCMKPCGTKCMKPCDSVSCNKPKCVECNRISEIAPLPCPAAIPCQTEYSPTYVTIMEDDLYSAVHRQCKDFAPVELQFVDFRLTKGQKYGSYSNKLGNYRFRIFGCRRESKLATLNQGRIMQKDMQFINIFDSIVSTCAPVVKTPHNLCLDKGQALPEYVLTAEITDYFMNVCDQYDWDNAAKANKRSGSSEMTVTWRLMDITKTNVLWKGSSTGYAEEFDGEYNGELALVERAFADAVNNLRQQPGFEDQLATRIHPEELARQRNALIAMQQKLDPVKCQYEQEITKIVEDQKCGKCPECPVLKEEIVITEEPVEVIFEEITIPEETPAILEDSGQEIIATEFNDGISIKTECGEGEEYIEGACLVKEIKDNQDYWIEHKNNVDTSNMLCIIGRNPYDEMTPENVYKVRTAIVAIQNAKNDKGAGLLISEQYILTSADLITKDNNVYDIETINGAKLKATAFRVNVNKNTALLLLDEPTKYTPLSLNTELPEIGKNCMSLGLLDFKTDSGEGYLENKGKVTGYRYSDEMGAEIIVDTFVQTVTIGGALIDERGTIQGIAHAGKKFDDGPDLFMPIEDAIKSVGLSICGQEPKEEKIMPVSNMIEQNAGPKDPAVLKKKDRK